MVQPPRPVASPLRFVALVAVAWVAAASVHAAAPATPARLGLCAACHGETGMAQIPGAPNLAGQKVDYLREALKQYRDGRRNVPLMRTVIGPVSDADLDELARWYSAQTPQTQGNP
jgi:cytochrome c553